MNQKVCGISRVDLGEKAISAGVFYKVVSAEMKLPPFGLAGTLRTSETTIKASVTRLSDDVSLKQSWTKAEIISETAMVLIRWRYFHHPPKLVQLHYFSKTWYWQSQQLWRSYRKSWLRQRWKLFYWRFLKQFFWPLVKSQWTGKLRCCCLISHRPVFVTPGMFVLEHVLFLRFKITPPLFSEYTVGTETKSIVVMTVGSSNNHETHSVLAIVVEFRNSWILSFLASRARIFLTPIFLFTVFCTWTFKTLCVVWVDGILCVYFFSSSVGSQIPGRYRLTNFQNVQTWLTNTPQSNIKRRHMFSLRSRIHVLTRHQTWLLPADNHKSQASVQPNRFPVRLPRLRLHAVGGIHYTIDCYSGGKEENDIFFKSMLSTINSTKIDMKKLLKLIQDMFLSTLNGLQYIMCEIFNRNRTWCCKVAALWNSALPHTFTIPPSICSSENRK